MKLESDKILEWAGYPPFSEHTNKCKTATDKLRVILLIAGVINKGSEVFEDDLGEAAIDKANPEIMLFSIRKPAAALALKLSQLTEKKNPDVMAAVDQVTSAPPELSESHDSNAVEATPRADLLLVDRLKLFLPQVKPLISQKLNLSELQWLQLMLLMLNLPANLLTTNEVTLTALQKRKLKFIENFEQDQYQEFFKVVWLHLCERMYEGDPRLQEISVIINNDEILTQFTAPIVPLYSSDDLLLSPEEKAELIQLLTVNESAPLHEHPSSDDFALGGMVNLDDNPDENTDQTKGPLECAIEFYEALLNKPSRAFEAPNMVPIKAINQSVANAITARAPRPEVQRLGERRVIILTGFDLKNLNTQGGAFKNAIIQIAGQTHSIAIGTLKDNFSPSTYLTKDGTQEPVAQLRDPLLAILRLRSEVIASGLDPRKYPTGEDYIKASEERSAIGGSSLVNIAEAIDKNGKTFLDLFRTTYQLYKNKPIYQTGRLFVKRPEERAENLGWVDEYADNIESVGDFFELHQHLLRVNVQRTVDGSIQVINYALLWQKFDEIKRIYPQVNEDKYNRLANAIAKTSKIFAKIHYEAIANIAILQALASPSKPVPLILTLVGAIAFNNSPEVIAYGLQCAIDKIKASGCPNIQVVVGAHDERDLRILETFINANKDSFSIKSQNEIGEPPASMSHRYFVAEQDARASSVSPLAVQF